MDYIGATPQSNPIMGLLAERLKQAQQFATRPFGYQNPPAEMLLNLLGVPAVQQTAERLAYGEPLTTGRGMTTQIRPEVAEAALTVAPVAGLLGRGAEKAAMAAGRAGERYAERVVPQIMEKGGMPAQLLQDLSQGSIRPMDVWHGSPHGPFEKFDPTKIGSGEGAQAFSYGHYLGEARGTGEQYRDMLKQKQFAKIVEKGRNDFDVIAPDGTVLAEGVYRGAAQKVYDNFNKEAGYLYKVDLPDEAIANMLDWDKPVSKQPNVMKALRSEAEQRVRDRKIVDIENDIRASLPSSDIGDDYLSMFSDANVGINQDIQKQALEKLNKMDLKPLVDKELDSMKPADMNWSMTGKEFYELLSKREGSPEKASGLLQRQGVPGTRYLDQQSRTPGGSDTSNFVVYPGGEDLLTIKEINDKPVGGLLGQSKAAESAPITTTKGLPVGASIKSVDDFAEMASKGKVNMAKSQKQEIADLVAGKSKFAEANLNWDMPETYDLADNLAKKGFKSKVDDRGITRFYKNEKDLEAIESAQTPADYGKAYGYSDEDVAAFYLKRRGGDKEAAYQDFLADVIKPKKKQSLLD